MLSGAGGGTAGWATAGGTCGGVDNAGGGKGGAVGGAVQDCEPAAALGEVVGPALGACASLGGTAACVCFEFADWLDWDKNSRL